MIDRHTQLDDWRPAAIIRDSCGRRVSDRVSRAVFEAKFDQKFQSSERRDELRGNLWQIAEKKASTGTNTLTRLARCRFCFFLSFLFTCMCIYEWRAARVSWCVCVHNSRTTYMSHSLPSRALCVCKGLRLAQIHQSRAHQLGLASSECERPMSCRRCCCLWLTHSCRRRTNEKKKKERKAAAEHNFYSNSNTRAKGVA